MTIDKVVVVYEQRVWDFPNKIHSATSLPYDDLYIKQVVLRGAEIIFLAFELPSGKRVCNS
jgi:hypothetical protein